MWQQMRDDRAQVDVELHVDALGRDLGHVWPTPTPRCDEHIEPTVLVAVSSDDLLDLSSSATFAASDCSS